MKRLIPILLLIILAACGEKEEFRTSRGVKVTYLTHGNGSSPQYDSVLILYMRQTTIADKVLHHSYPSFPLPIPYSKDQKGDLIEVISHLVVGDSVYFQTTAKNLYEETYKQPIPNFLIPESTMKIHLKLAYQFSPEQYNVYIERIEARQDSIYRAQQALAIDQLLVRQADSISNILNQKGVVYTRTTSGLHYQFLKRGDGSTVERGEEATISYTATLLSGEVIDQKTDFKVVSGVGRLLPGLEESFSLLPIGSKAVLYLPGPLAFGTNPPPNSFPINTILIYEIEISK